MKKLFSTKNSELSIGIALFVLRVSTGVLMVPHGYDKLIHFTEKSARFSDPFHIGSTASLALVVFAEFFCAILLIGGLLTRLAAFPLVVAMAVALFKAHGGDFFGDGQTAALFLAASTCILFAGAGKFSLDGFIGK